MSKQLELKSISVAFDQVNVVNQINLSLKEGEIGCLLGPSGCGKTTLLRSIAGFETPSEGEIWLHNRQVSSQTEQIPPEKRRVGMVFQDFALFPHLTIADNIGFGLEHLAKPERANRVTELLHLIGLEEAARRHPHQLSGGQQQRVALARAMAPRPDILLLDEPFSALDPELRTQLANEVRSLLHKDGITAILVTHDQTEAFAMADRIGVMSHGSLHQWDSGYNLYHRPDTDFVAGFIGRGVLLPARIADRQHVETPLGKLACNLPSDIELNRQVRLLLRPDDIAIGQGDLKATVLTRLFQGADYLYSLTLDSGEKVECLAPSHQVLSVGDTISLSLDIRDLVLFSEEGQAIN